MLTFIPCVLVECYVSGAGLRNSYNWDTCRMILIWHEEVPRATGRGSDSLGLEKPQTHCSLYLHSCSVAGIHHLLRSFLVYRVHLVSKHHRNHRLFPAHRAVRRSRMGTLGHEARQINRGLTEETVNNPEQEIDCARLPRGLERRWKQGFVHHLASFMFLN